MKEYHHELTGSTIKDLGDGRVMLALRHAPDHPTFLSQEAWLVETVEGIAKEAGKALDFLFDLSGFEPPLWDAFMRKHALASLESSEILNKSAIVGDSIVFMYVGATLAALSSKRDRVKFFFHIEDAKDWLGW